MNNHWQVGFLSVLLILILFFSLMKPEDKEKSFTVIRPIELEGMISYTCDAHSIEIMSNGAIVFKGKLLNLNEYISGLRQLRCPTHALVIKAGENTETGVVMEASNELAKALPDLKIAWAESGT